MLVQRAGTGMLPPPAITPPPWNLLARQWNSAPALPIGSGTVTIGPAEIILGHEDSEANDELAGSGIAPEHQFGWDNESPRRVVKLGRVRVSWRCVTNGEYAAYLEGEGKGKVEMPKSWVMDGGEIQVWLRSTYK
jgi:L-histidine Nalpha-methyltransferase / hercynylcysteine S-oxide synthase